MKLNYQHDIDFKYRDISPLMELIQFIRNIKRIVRERQADNPY